MSYLIRTGTGRNNISWSTTANSSTKYLRRLGSGRNNVAWTTIPSGNTYNILQRNGTGRNNVLWSNLSIKSEAEKKVDQLLSLLNMVQGYFYAYGQSRGTYSYNSSTHVLTVGNYTAGNYRTEWGYRYTGAAIDEAYNDGKLGSYNNATFVSAINNLFIPIKNVTVTAGTYDEPYKTVYIQNYGSVEYDHVTYTGYGGMGFRYSDSPINNSNTGSSRLFRRNGSSYFGYTYENIRYEFDV